MGVLAGNNLETGRFEQKHSAVCAIVDRVLKSVKDFVGVVSTCACIVEVLPATPKGQRATKILEHLATTQKTGATLPQNLKLYLEAEQKKASKLVAKAKEQ